MSYSFLSPPQTVILPGINGQCRRCRFDLRGYSPHLFAHYGIEMPPSIQRSVPKRAAEFLAGRYLAKLTMQAMFNHCEQVAIGAHRAPVWPMGMCGAISHSHDQAVCVITSTHHTLGIDIEAPLMASVAAELTTSIVDHAEQRILQAQSHHYPLALTIAFSAKESLFKALYPHVKCYFDFLDVALISMDQHAVIFRLLRDLSKERLAGQDYRVNYLLNNGYVLTFTQII